MSTRNYNTSANNHAPNNMTPERPVSGNADYRTSPERRNHEIVEHDEYATYERRGYEAANRYGRGYEGAERHSYAERDRYGRTAYEPYDRYGYGECDPYGYTERDRYGYAERDPYGRTPYPYVDPREDTYSAPERRPRRGAAVAVAVALVLALGGVGGAMVMMSRNNAVQPAKTAQTQVETKKSAPTTQTQTTQPAQTNTQPAQTNTQPANNNGNNNAGNAGTTESVQTESHEQGPRLIGENAALNSALANLGWTEYDNQEVDLVIGGDAPHYNVTLTLGDETHTIEVDAYSAAIMS